MTIGGSIALIIIGAILRFAVTWTPNGIDLRTKDEPGFWEQLGYHNYGDPWREQRYWGD